MGRRILIGGRSFLDARIQRYKNISVIPKLITPKDRLYQVRTKKEQSNNLFSLSSRKLIISTAAPRAEINWRNHRHRQACICRINSIFKISPPIILTNSPQQAPIIVLKKRRRMTPLENRQAAAVMEIVKKASAQFLKCH